MVWLGLRGWLDCEYTVCFEINMLVSIYTNQDVKRDKKNWKACLSSLKNKFTHVPFKISIPFITQTKRECRRQDCKKLSLYRSVKWIVQKNQPNPSQSFTLFSQHFNPTKEMKNDSKKPLKSLCYELKFKKRTYSILKCVLCMRTCQTFKKNVKIHV